MIVKVRYPLEKPIVLESQTSSRNNISNANYRSKFYPENASFLQGGEEEDPRRRKNVSLPKITKNYNYNNPYNPDDTNVYHFDREEKREFQQFKANVGVLENNTRPNPTTPTPTIKNINNNNVIANENETNILPDREIIGNNNQDVSCRINNNNEKPSQNGYYGINGKPEVNYRHLNLKQEGLPPLNHIRNCNSNEKVHHPLKLYTIKDYKEIKKTFDYIKGIEKGGLGPSIKDDKWVERKKLVEKMMRFSHDVKVINTSKIAKFLEESVSKEKSSYNKNLNTSTRQKAWEFARNIDPPKIKKKKQDFETILEKDDLEDTLEYYEQKHRDLAKKLEKNKGKKM